MTDTNTNKVKEKQIGPWLVSIEGDSISIIGDSGSNFGRIYRHAQERFERHPQGAEHDWNRPQIIGMDWDLGMVPAVKAWIYSNL